MAKKSTKRKPKKKVKGKATSGTTLKPTRSRPQLNTTNRKTRNPNLMPNEMGKTETPDYYKKMLNDGEFSESLIKAALMAALEATGGDKETNRELANVWIEEARRDPGKTQELVDIAINYKAEKTRQREEREAASARIDAGQAERGDYHKRSGNDINKFLTNSLHGVSQAIVGDWGIVPQTLTAAAVSQFTPTAGMTDFVGKMHDRTFGALGRQFDEMWGYDGNEPGGAVMVVQKAKNKHKKSVTNKVYKVARSANTGTPVSVAMLADLHAAAIVAGNSPKELATASGGGVVDDYVLQQFQAALTLAGE